MTDFKPKFVISSHVSSVDKPAKRLVQSLLKNGIPAGDILVVVGGAESGASAVKNGVAHVWVTHNSYDHTGLIYLVENNNSYPWWWLLHDTVEVGPDFYKTILKRGATHAHISLGEEGWMNMGLFSMQFLLQAKNYILSLKNCSKMRAILSERMFPRLTISSFYTSSGKYQIKGHLDVYGDGVIRRAIYFPGIDVYKYQGFYLEKKQTMEFLRGEEARYKFNSKLPV